jgi:hypothetical protein
VTDETLRQPVDPALQSSGSRRHPLKLLGGTLRLEQNFYRSGHVQLRQQEGEFLPLISARSFLVETATLDAQARPGGRRWDRVATQQLVVKRLGKRCGLFVGDAGRPPNRWQQPRSSQFLTQAHHHPFEV